MPPASLAPIRLAPDSLEALLAERAPEGHAVYLLILALVAASLGLLPVVRVPVWVQSSGIVRPALEKMKSDT